MWASSVPQSEYIITPPFPTILMCQNISLIFEGARKQCGDFLNRVESHSYLISNRNINLLISQRITVIRLISDSVHSFAVYVGLVKDTSFSILGLKIQLSQLVK